MRIYVKPAVRWIWWGAFVIAFGGLLAMLDKRYRKAGRVKPVPVTVYEPNAERAPKKLPSDTLNDTKGVL